MSCVKWKAAHGSGQNNRPNVNDVKAFLPADVFVLFEEFSKYLARQYGISCKPPIYTETNGWVFPFGRSSVMLLNGVAIHDGAFEVNGLHVSNEAEYDQSIKLIDKIHADGFAERFARETAVKNERQKQNTKRRLAREKTEMEALSARIDKNKFNKYRWSPKLSRQKLLRLYDSDAHGIQDDDLLDDVGFTLYARCKQGMEEGELKNAGRLRCHNCRTVLKRSRSLMQCECGRQYLFRDYMRAFIGESMPHGAASHIFAAFVKDWETAKSYPAKMRLVDNLVHEFHINLNSGVKGRFVGINLIAGTKKQIGDLILQLAYGDNTKTFISNLKKE
jgi:hypothetical protein